MSAPPEPQSGSFDPKVRRFGVQTLDENQQQHLVQADQEPPLLPSTAPVTSAPISNSEESKEQTRSKLDSTKPDFKIGASLLLIPIYDFGLDGTKDKELSRIHQRARLSTAMKWRSLGVKAEMQDVRAWGQNTSPGAASNFVNTALFQGYMELVGESKARDYRSFVRVGRQAIVWGDQRLMGAGTWTIHGRSHDAIRAFVGLGKYEIDAFWSVRRPSTAPSAPKQDSGSHLGGLRLSSLHLSYLSAEATGLLHHEDGDAPDTTETFGNLGLRLHGDIIPPLHYSLEGNFQFGDRRGLEHRAWATAGWASWLQRLPGAWALRFRLGASAASGQKDPTKSREFFNFYPSNHRHYGIVDRIGWRNMVDYEFRAQAELDQTFNVGAAFHYFLLESEKGAWKNAAGVLLSPNVPVGAPESGSLGSELDFFANYRPLRGLHLQFGYGLWMPTQDGYTRLNVPAGQRSAQQRVFLLMNAKL